MWSEVIDIAFYRVSSGVPDIEIRFEIFAHGDGAPFDGKGKTFGHAFYPNHKKFAGDIHFDDCEFWTHKETQG